VIPTLEDKLAAIVHYLLQVRRGYRSSDPVGFNSWLDDGEVCDWHERMDKAGRTVNHTRTISR
jgi:hypothetical protein